MNKENKLTPPGDSLVMIELTDEELAGITGGWGHDCCDDDDDDCGHHHHHHHHHHHSDDCWDDNDDCD